MTNKNLNEVPNLSKRPISDDELELVSGGATYTPKDCPKCHGDMYNLTGNYVCQNCGYSE